MSPESSPLELSQTLNDASRAAAVARLSGESKAESERDSSGEFSIVLLIMTPVALKFAVASACFTGSARQLTQNFQSNKAVIAVSLRTRSGWREVAVFSLRDLSCD